MYLSPVGSRFLVASPAAYSFRLCKAGQARTRPGPGLGPGLGPKSRQADRVSLPAIAKTVAEMSLPFLVKNHLSLAQELLFTMEQNSVSTVIFLPSPPQQVQLPMRQVWDRIKENWSIFSIVCPPTHA